MAAFLRATNRAIVECLANPAAGIAAVRQRESILDEKLELERWSITAQYVAAADTKSHGLGDFSKRLMEQQVDSVVQTFALKTMPSADALFNSSMLPARAARMLKA